MIEDHGRLPDDVYGSADCNVSDPRKLRVSATPASAGPGAQPLLHAFVGGIYVAMSERNWRALFAALGTLEVVEPPRTTHRINLDDTTGTATVTTEVTA